MKYWISYRNGKWREVEGEPVTIPGAEGFDFFVSNPGGGWVVSEVFCGAAVSGSWPSKRRAITQAKDVIKKYGSEPIATCHKVFPRYGIKSQSLGGNQTFSIDRWKRAEKKVRAILHTDKPQESEAVNAA